MRYPQLKRRDGAIVNTAAIAAFREGFAGQAILSQDDGYDAARQIWNASIDKRPGLIARCAGTTDVVRAVKFARANDLLVAIRSGGHNVAGRALCDDGIVIDLSTMTGVFVDTRQRTVRVRGGTTLGELDRETQLHGLAVPVGVVSRTGVAGLALGGGVGWLVRKHGLTCDNLLSCEVVTAKGEVITADAECHPELFWGLRGGGGNFGIVTSLLFRAHPVTTVLSGVVLYPRAVAAALFRHYRDFMATAPEELTAYAGLISTPEGAPVTAVILCYSGDITEGERMVQPLRSFGTPLMDAVQPMPFGAMQALFDSSILDNTFNYWKSTFLTELSDEAIGLIVDHGNRIESPLSATMIEFYGGAAGRVGSTDTAFGQRQAQFNIGINAQWTDPADSERHTGWARTMWDALRPYSSGGYFLNFLGDEPASTIRAAFGPNYKRLARLKAEYDPTNFFSLNQNILPATDPRQQLLACE